ncbi:SMR family transporter, partial [Staphylococcus saprophyticus]|uniref:SMR family transporter n=1 Tax=Staphylococcus saprophyticus TaxID=29385 RepID=UPI0021B2988A
ICFYFLTKTVQHLPLNITYPTSPPLPLLLTTLLSIIIFKQQINLITILSILLIILPLLSLNIFPTSH